MRFATPATARSSLPSGASGWVHTFIVYLPVYFMYKKFTHPYAIYFPPKPSTSPGVVEVFSAVNGRPVRTIELPIIARGNAPDRSINPGGAPVRPAGIAVEPVFGDGHRETGVSCNVAVLTTGRHVHVLDARDATLLFAIPAGPHPALSLTVDTAGRWLALGLAGGSSLIVALADAAAAWARATRAAGVDPGNAQLAQTAPAALAHRRAPTLKEGAWVRGNTIEPGDLSSAARATLSSSAAHQYEEQQAHEQGQEQQPHYTGDDSAHGPGRAGRTKQPSHGAADASFADDDLGGGAGARRGAGRVVPMPPQAARWNRARLRSILARFGAYPREYRVLVWRFLLQIPDGYQDTYARYTRMGLHPSTVDPSIRLCAHFFFFFFFFVFVLHIPLTCARIVVDDVSKTPIRLHSSRGGDHLCPAAPAAAALGAGPLRAAVCPRKLLIKPCSSAVAPSAAR
jgi:hypothetical protein